MNTKLLALYGLKFHPFHADVPTEALYATPAVEAFLRRVELTIADGGFAMLTGDPGIELHSMRSFSRSLTR